MAHRALLVALLVLVVSAGCLADGPREGSTQTPAPTARTTTPVESAGAPVDTATTDAGSTVGATSTRTATENVGFEPHNGTAPLSVQLTNRLDRWVELRVEVVDRSNETHHTATYDVAPNGKPWTVYEHPATAADGPVRVVVTARGTTETLTVDTGNCGGSVHAQVTAEGDLRLFVDRC